MCDKEDCPICHAELDPLYAEETALMMPLYFGLNLTDRQLLRRVAESMVGTKRASKEAA